MAARKLQQEIDKCFKKVAEGVATFESIYDKIIQTSNPSQKEKLEDQLKSIVDAALEGKRVDLHDNLFEIGASSLKLIEIHENIDREYPGLVDLTELFDFPTIAELSRHLEGKLAATV